MPHLRPFLPCILKKMPGIWKLRPAYSNFIKIIDFTLCMTFKFNGWPHKTIGHLFYPMSSFVHHFIAISELKLELQFGNAKFGSKSVIFLSRVTLKFDGWSWKTIRHLFYAALSFVHNFIAIGEFNLELQSGNAQFGSKLKVFLSRATLKFDRWPWKMIGHLFYTTLSFVHHFIAINEFKLKLVQKRLIWVKIDGLLSRVTLKIDTWTWKTIGHLS